MRDLSRFAWLSVAAAIVTIALKTAGYFVTGSVGLLSDAAEFVVVVSGLGDDLQHHQRHHRGHEIDQ